MNREVLEELVTKFVYDVDQIGLQKYENAQKRINKNTKQMIGLNSTLLKGFRRFVGFLGAGIGIKSLIDTYKGLDLTRRSIEGLTKSTQDWDYVQKEAIRTGTGIEAVAKGYRNFYSAASMAGFDKTGIQDMYSDVLTASRAIGATQQQVGGALLALEQMLSKGKVSMEELRRQLGNALPGAFEIGAKAMGVTTQKFNEMVKKGISSAEFVPKFTKELLNTYKDAFPEAIKSLDFAIVNLSTSWKLFQYEIMNGSAGQGLAQTLNSLTEFLRSPQAIAIAKGIGLALNMVVRALGFVIKHIRIILLLFGIQMLNQLPNLLSIMTKNLIYFNKHLIKTGGLLKIIGKAGFLMMRNFGWVVAFSAILGVIALALQDIFMYLKDPNALTLTRELVAKSPAFAKTIERIRDGIEAWKKIWNEELAPSLNNFMQVFSDWVKGQHPLLGGLFKFIIEQLAKILNMIADIIVGWQKITNSTPLAEKEKIQDARKRSQKRTWDALTTAGTFIASPAAGMNKIAWNALNSRMNDNGYMLQKSENNTQNNTYNINITGGANSTPNDIANAVMSKLGNEIDVTKNLYTPYLKY